MENFNKYIDHLLGFEGGYVNDPVDRGGETKWGISKRSYPHLDIRSLTKDDASKIYYKDYWTRSGAHMLPEEIQYIHFDTAVNSGVRTAIKILQRACGSVKIDGVLGQKTHAAAAAVSLAEYISERAVFYARICRRDPSQLRFIVGWMRRLKKISKL